MTKYKFIKISNNNNSSKDFMIDITTMADDRLRISTLKSQLKKYRYGMLPNCEYKQQWYFIEHCDWSYYCLETKEFDTFEEAKEYRLDLMDREYIRMNPEENKNLN